MNQSVFVLSIGEPRRNVLRVVVQEGVVNPSSETLEVGGTKIEGVHRVEPTGCIREYIWEGVVAYCVTTESYSSQHTEEQFSGTSCRNYSSSRFLEFVKGSTIASDEYPGPLIHTALVAEDHIIDVVATALPTVSELDTVR